MSFECSDVDSVANYPGKTRAALVIDQWRIEIVWIETRIARVNGRASGQKGVCEGWPTVVLQWAELRIRINLVARRDKKPAPIITAQVVAE